MNADLCFGFPKSKWLELSQRLDGTDESAWAEAIDVFKRRLTERFFNSIDALVAADTKLDASGSDSANSGRCIPGFVIVALCCLVIEALQGFRAASNTVANPKGPCTFPSGPCIRPATGTNQQFIEFLHRPAFGTAFHGMIGRKFVNGIRNGILHEAETRKWVIWREEPVGKIAAQEEDGYALNRTLFYAAIKSEFESYLQELHDPGQKDLRERFKEKMGDLCGET